MKTTNNTQAKQVVKANNNATTTNVKQTALSKAISKLKEQPKKDDNVKVTINQTKEKEQPIKEQKVIKPEDHHFGLQVDGIVKVTIDGKEKKGQVLRFGLIKKTGRSRCRVIFLDDKGKLTKEHKGFYSSIVTPIGEVGKESAKDKFKEIKGKITNAPKEQPKEQPKTAIKK